MVPPCSDGISRVPPYSGYQSLTLVFVYMALTFFGVLSHTLRLTIMILILVHTPKVFLLSVWPLPRSLTTTSGISFDFSSLPYLDVSVQAVPHIHLCIQCMLHGHSPCGFPHSEICGSKDICSSPQLIAAYHVFLRLPVPRHSPCALFSLTVFFAIF